MHKGKEFQGTNYVTTVTEVQERRKKVRRNGRRSIKNKMPQRQNTVALE
jgi:hypothetical protein